MPLYQMFCITSHRSEYVRFITLSKRIDAMFRPLLCNLIYAALPTFISQQHIKSLVRQTAMHVMNAGGVVRSVESLGTRVLPQRMRRQGTTHNVGE